MSAPRLVDEISNPPGHLSYSSAPTWHDCPANYAAIREQPHLDTVTPAQIRGTLTHWVTETVCREAQQAGMDPGWDGQVMADLAVEAVEAFRADPGNTDDTAMFDSWSAQEQANILASVVECLTRLRFLDPLPAGIEIVGVEQRLETTVGGVPFVSIVDLAYRTSSGVVLVDWKTGKAPAPRYRSGVRRQLRLGAAAWFNSTGVMPVGVQAVWLGDPSGTETIAAVRAEVSAAVGWMRRAWDGIHAAEFAPNGSPLCGWCPLVAVCPTGQQVVTGRDTEGRSTGPHGAAWLATQPEPSHPF